MIARISEAIALGVLLVIVASVFYRRLCHPLRSYPGPWLNSVSVLPSALMLAVGKQHTYYYKLHEAYGPVVRVAPNELSFTNVCAWNEIYGVKNGQAMDKAPSWTGSASHLGGAVSIGQASGKEHQRHRRALAPGLTKAAVNEQRAMIQSHVDKLITNLRQSARERQAVNMTDWVTLASFDIIGDLCFSEPFGCLEERSATSWATAIPDLLLEAIREQSIRLIFGVDNFLQRLVTLLLPAKGRLSKMRHFQKSKEKTFKRLENKSTQRRDMIRLIEESTQSTDTPQLSPTELLLDVTILLVAGSETTSNLLSAWVFLICTHKDACKRLAEEVRTNISSNEDVDANKVLSLPYLRACINETLRLFPSAATSQQRVVPDGGAIIDGHTVPVDTVVSVAQWATNRLPSHFHRPNDFCPERWLDTPDKMFVEDCLDVSQPFSYGARYCIGRNLAELEARLIIVGLLLNFDMKPTTGIKYAKLNRQWTMSPDASSVKAYQSIRKMDFWVELDDLQAEK